MKLLRPRTWGIAARLVLVATIPALIMFVAVSIALYVAGRQEVARALQQRGELLAGALAETSQYAVASGDVSFLDRNVRQIVKTDPGIASIEVFDADRARLVGVTTMAATDGVVFERPIRLDVPDINLFDQVGPHVSAPTDAQPGFRSTQISGYVRVMMSEAPILREQRRRLYLSGLMVLLTTVASGLTGLYLAQKLRVPLGAVMAALRQIRSGNFDVRLIQPATGELGELQQTIEEMAKGLSIKQNELEAQVAERTRELQVAADDATEADAEKRRLIARTNTLLEEERQRIAIEIHDHLNASLIVLGMKAQQIAALAAQPMEAGARKDIEALAHAIAAATEGLYSTARGIVKQLRPEVIDTLGLKGAVAEMVRNYDEMHPGCRFALRASDDFPDLRGELAITAYRLVQEALSNVVKHSGASDVQIGLDRHATLPLVLIAVKDDGQGFDPASCAKDSIGLIGMRERVSACNGTMTIDSVLREGTSIKITLPLVATS